jgi:hypothetical protein
MPVGEKKIKRGLHAEEPGEDRHFTHFERPRWFVGAYSGIASRARPRGSVDARRLGGFTVMMILDVALK